ncbi:MAG: hypothetical protein WC455_29740 [Dehalococcoidia bacterium]|jgi:hypothetical protein
MPANTELITQAQLDGMEAHIRKMKHDRELFWLDKKLYGRISGEIIRCQGELHELTRLYKLQSFVVRASGVIITPLCSYAEAVGVAEQVGGEVEPRANS